MQNESNWEVTLDHRRLKTPNGKVLTVPSESLARAIATEWDAQTEIILQPTMHLVRQNYLCIEMLIIIVSVARLTTQVMYIKLHIKRNVTAKKFFSTNTVHNNVNTKSNR